LWEGQLLEPSFAGVRSVVTRDEIDSMISSLEAAARRRPRLFIARTAALVALAYTYLVLVLLGSLTVCVLLAASVFYEPAAAKFALIGVVAAGGLFFAVLRGLWVELPPPTGEMVSPDQAPGLFRLLSELSATLNCRSFHAVFMTADANAGVVQIPRFGIFGCHQSYLTLGLPLMLMVTPEEFKAVLAHELAHSSRGHGRFGNWLYRVRKTWAQIFEQMAKQRTRGGGVLLSFINWFWPVFNGHGFVLARAYEYEADACAVRVAGADVAASALIRLSVATALARERFWPDIFSRANQEKNPPPGVMLSLGETLRTGAVPTDAARWLRQAFLTETNNVDTHPSLKDRLRAMGRLPAGDDIGELPAVPVSQTAAERFLGGFAEIVAKRMSDDWQRMIKSQWEARHKEAQRVAGELNALEQTPDAAPTSAQIWERAWKVSQLQGDAAAVAALEQILALEPKHAGANFILGRHYLSTDDPRGVQCLEVAIVSDPELGPQGCMLLHAHFRRTGQRSRVRQVEDRLDQFQKRHALAFQERIRISASDTYVEHGLNDEQIADLRRIFTYEPEIDSAAVARKRLEHSRDSPVFVIGLKVRAASWKPRTDKEDQLLMQHVARQIRLPGYVSIFVRRKRLEGLGIEVFAVPGSVIYERA